MLIGKLKSYLEQNESPGAWKRAQIRLLPEFNKRGLFLHSMTDDKELDRDLVMLISDTLKSIYQKGIPVTLLNEAA